MKYIRRIVMVVCADCFGTGLALGGKCATCQGTGEVKRVVNEIVHEDDEVKAL